jgi:dihydroorotase
VETGRLKSKSKNSPFLGWKMKGRASFTLVGGRVVHEGVER